VGETPPSLPAPHEGSKRDGRTFFTSMPKDSRVKDLPPPPAFKYLNLLIQQTRRQGRPSLSIWTYSCLLRRRLGSLMSSSRTSPILCGLIAGTVTPLSLHQKEAGTPSPCTGFWKASIAGDVMAWSPFGYTTVFAVTLPLPPFKGRQVFATVIPLQIQSMTEPVRYAIITFWEN
jgi:hypothetical protein